MKIPYEEMLDKKVKLKDYPELGVGVIVDTNNRKSFNLWVTFDNNREEDRWCSLYELEIVE